MPLRLELVAPVDRVHVRVDLLGNEEVLVGVPAERALGSCDFVRAQRGAVRFRSVDGVRRAECDVRADDDQRRARKLSLRVRDRLTQGRQVVRVGDELNVPPERLEALGAILREGDRRRPVDRDVIVVVEVDELPERVRSGERARLVRDALHEVAVRADRIDAVVDDLVVRPVEGAGQEPLGEPQANAVCEPLPERAGRHLDAFRMPELRVARGGRLPLPETLQLLERQVVARRGGARSTAGCMRGRR